MSATADPPASDLAARAWASLAAAFMSQREAWLSAGQAERLNPPQAMMLMRLDPDAPPRLGDLARFLRCDMNAAASDAHARAARSDAGGSAVADMPTHYTTESTFAY